MNKKVKKKKQKTIEEKLYIKHKNIIKKCDKILRTKQKIEDHYDNLFKKILENTHKLWLPVKKKKQVDTFINDNNGCEYTSHSWFNITEYNAPTVNEIYNVNIKVPKMDIIMKSEKIKMYPNNIQKQLLLNWMSSYVRMYNETLKLFKKNRLANIKFSLNWKKVRTLYLKNIKENIISKSNIKITDNNGNKIG